MPHVDASYRASVVHDLRGGLTERTRVRILKEIEDWAKRSPDDKSQPIYFMKGAFGTGKSAIAHEVAERLDDECQLSASFFFIRDAPGLCSPDLFFSTIARQLAFSQPLLRQYIIDAARSFARRGVDKPSMESQIRELLVEPLKRAPDDCPPIVIIVDGFDECSEKDTDSRTQMLGLLLSAVLDIPTALRILISTRPIRDIEYAFQFSDKKEFILHDVARAEVDDDIRLYLQNALVGGWGAALLEDHPDAIAILTTMAEGLFVSAGTAVRFLAEYPSIVVKRFDHLRSRMADKGAVGLRQIDVLYMVILDAGLSKLLDDRDLPFEMVDLVKKILSSIALLREQLPLSALCDLLTMQESHATLVLERLKSVILLPGNPKHGIRALHASFSQFLIDNERCTDVRFYVDELEGHEVLSIACLSHFDKPGIVYRGGGSRFIEEPHIGYSCRNWITHLAASTLTPSLMDALKAFRKQNTGFVREELSVMGYFDRSTGESVDVSAQTHQVGE